MRCLRLRCAVSVALLLSAAVSVAIGGTVKIGIKGYKAEWGGDNGAITVADFDGDGKYDFLVNGGLDGKNYTGWVMAVRHDGTLFWAKKISDGNEYHGLIAYDMDGDGRAEVYASSKNGWDIKKVDGMTGETVKTVGGIGQCVIAYLDGTRPSLVVVGDYLDANASVKHVTAFDKDLNSRWRLTTTTGMRCHTACAADVDADGRDEIVIGTVVIDDNGKQMHGRGGMHVDVAWVADFDWDNPGLEIYAAPYMIDGKSGALLWERKQCVGSYGFAGDVDPKYPGSEVGASHSYKESGADCAFSVLWSAKGEKIRSLTQDMKACAIWWDGTETQQIKSAPARQFLQADITGDWREELIWNQGATISVSSPDGSPKLSLPSLMTDRKYRCDVARGSRGINGKYVQPLIQGRIGDLGKATGAAMALPRSGLVRSTGAARLSIKGGRLHVVCGSSSLTTNGRLLPDRVELMRP